MRFDDLAADGAMSMQPGSVSEAADDDGGLLSLSTVASTGNDVDVVVQSDSVVKTQSIAVGVRHEHDRMQLTVEVAGALRRFRSGARCSAVTCDESATDERMDGGRRSSGCASTTAAKHTSDMVARTVMSGNENMTRDEKPTNVAIEMKLCTKLFRRKDQLLVH